MIFWDDLKFACKKCQTGHRNATCDHVYGRPLIEIKSKGRPVTQCNHCRERRKVRAGHSHHRCWCGDGSGPVKKKVEVRFSSGVVLIFTPEPNDPERLRERLQNDGLINLRIDRKATAGKRGATTTEGTQSESPELSASASVPARKGGKAPILESVQVKFESLEVVAETVDVDFEKFINNPCSCQFGGTCICSDLTAKTRTKKDAARSDSPASNSDAVSSSSCGGKQKNSPTPPLPVLTNPNTSAEPNIPIQFYNSANSNPQPSPTYAVLNGAAFGPLQPQVPLAPRPAHLSSSMERYDAYNHPLAQKVPYNMFSAAPPNFPQQPQMQFMPYPNAQAPQYNYNALPGYYQTPTTPSSQDFRQLPQSYAPDISSLSLLAAASAGMPPSTKPPNGQIVRASSGSKCCSSKSARPPPVVAPQPSGGCCGGSVTRTASSGGCCGGSSKPATSGCCSPHPVQTTVSGGCCGGGGGGCMCGTASGGGCMCATVSSSDSESGCRCSSVCSCNGDDEEEEEEEEVEELQTQLSGMSSMMMPAQQQLGGVSTAFVQTTQTNSTFAPVPMTNTTNASGGGACPQSAGPDFVAKLQEILGDRCCGGGKCGSVCQCPDQVSQMIAMT
ncbi:hypothetical protein BJ742DRAFT_29527 [Cladochytrium replicatum]|nr:hypothetical protein BJ742DRAFT_29527 [Cladochytrium replicatum]